MKETALFLSIFSFLLGLVHIINVYLFLYKKRTVNNLIFWLIITVLSIFVAIISLIHNIFVKMPLMFPIAAIIGTTLLAIALIRFIIYLKKNTNKKS